MNEVELTEGRRRRRTYSQEFKSEVIQCCQQLGVSVAAVARAYDLHPNLLRRWLTVFEQQARAAAPVPAVSAGTTMQTQTAFISLDPQTCASPMPPRKTERIHVEVTGAGLTARVSWPMEAARDCANWLKCLMQ